MLIDLASGRVDFAATTYDVCIAGAGIAGIALSLTLARSGRRVLLLEAGGLDVSDASQAFYRGENTGVENLPLDQTRIRALGGSSNHWGGWCIPRDPFDFERTDMTADGGWPIRADALAPYLDRALELLRVTQSTGAELDLAKSAGNLRTMRVYFSAPPANFRQLYLDDLSASESITLVVNAPVVEVSLDPAGGRVASLAVSARGPAPPIQCQARHFVLAQGAVENIRSLLLLNRKYAGRLGKAGDWLGRGYMQHLHQVLGHFLTADASAVSGAPAATQAQQVFLASTRKLLSATGTGAFRLYTRELNCEGLYNELRQLTGASCSVLASGGLLLGTCEQLPNPRSRVTLLAERDALGVPRVKLDWQVTAADQHTLREAAIEFGRYLVRAGTGRLKINPALLEGSRPLEGWVKLAGASGAAGHQMGGTRMSGTAAAGVVDPDCRVWGMDNLYIAGSSVFRTSGHATPTVTIFQLALRLADRLHAVLART